MKKKFIALFAACSMITTAVAGLVQTAYADDDPIRIEVSDGATDTEKVLTFYYGPEDGVNMIEGYLTLNNGATIDSAAITISIPAGMGDQVAKTDDGHIMCLTYADDPLTSADKSFATATITVPGDVDVTASFSFEMFDSVDNDFSDTVNVTIPKKASDPDPEPAAVTAVEKQNSVSGEGIYAAQTADVYAVELAVNDQVVSGVTVKYDDEHQATLNFDTEVTGGSVVFAVILANVSGVAALPAFDDLTITPIVE